MTSSENKTYNLNNLCFLCLKYNKNVLYYVNNYLKVQDKLKYFLPEQILEKIETPRYVCDNCVDRLDSINEFRKECLDNIIVFNDYIKKMNQAPNSDKYLSVTSTDISHSKNSEIVNFEYGIPNCDQNVKREIFETEITNCDQNVKSEIFETESLEPIKYDESKEIFNNSSNIQQIFIKTENIEDENIEEFSVKNEINELIIKDEPFLLENIPQEECNKDTLSSDEYNYCDTTSTNNPRRDFVEIDEFQWEENQNENFHLLSNEYSSSCDASIKNDYKLSKSLAIEEEGEIRNSQINSDKCYTPKKLESHSNVETEKKLHTCDFCEKQFQRKANFFRHKRMHTGERPFVCEICKKAFTDKSNLMSHKRFHANERPYECDICNKKFNLISILNDHKLIHSSDKPHQCDVCRKQFKKKANLNRHKHTHSDERPFVCNICGKAFKDISNLTNHNLIHADEKPYECDICQKKFVRKTNLNQHKLIHTGEKYTNVMSE